MSTDANSELLSFHQFIGKQLSSGRASLSPEAALEVWRLQNRPPEEYQEDIEAIRQALVDMEAGDTGIAWDEFDREFRKKHKLDLES